jgi:hypothetical protein
MSKSPLYELLDFHQETMKVSDAVLSDCPWENRDYYAHWCGQSYYLVAHATRMLAASAARLPLDRDDAHMRFIDHCQEEKHHEKLYENDLKFMGRKVQEFEEHPLTSSLYQSQYYLLDYKDAIAPMGGIFYLEGVSVYSGNMLLDRCVKAHGEKACTFLTVHIHDDQDHMKKAEMLLSKMTPAELAVVKTSYHQFSYAYMQFLKELRHMSGVSKSKNAA